MGNLRLAIVVGIALASGCATSPPKKMAYHFNHPDFADKSPEEESNFKVDRGECLRIAQREAPIRAEFLQASLNAEAASHRATAEQLSQISSNSGAPSSASFSAGLAMGQADAAASKRINFAALKRDISLECMVERGWTYTIQEEAV